MSSKDGFSKFIYINYCIIIKIKFNEIIFLKKMFSFSQFKLLMELRNLDYYDFHSKQNCFLLATSYFILEGQKEHL